MKRYTVKKSMFNGFALKAQRHRDLLSDPRAVASLLIATFIAVLCISFVQAQGDLMRSARHDRLLGIALILIVVGTAWIGRLASARAQERKWRRLAGYLNLHCQRRGLAGGYAVDVTGRYCGRNVWLGTATHMGGLRAVVKVRNEDGASLRLRGPFSASAVVADGITRELFASSHSHPIGNARQFYARSNPSALVDALPQHEELWRELTALPDLVTIELYNEALSIERTGPIDDLGELQRTLDLASSLADVIEQPEIM